MSWLSDFLSPPAANVQLPAMQTATGIPGAQQSVQTGIQNLGQYNTYDIPGAQGVTQSLMNNPGTDQYLAGADRAARMGQNAATNAYGAGGGLYSMGRDVANTAFDPQQDLYNRTLAQLQQQQRAGQAARGVAMTPYGAGLENQALSNFNIDWQNAQLQRQLQGLSGASQAFGQGATMQNAAPGQYLTAAGMPYGVNQQIGQNQFNALNQMGQFGQGAAGIPQTQIGDWQNYLGYGNNVAGTNNQVGQLGLNQSALGFNQQQSMFNNLGRVAGAALPFIPGMGNMGLGMGSFMGSGSFNRG